MLTKKEDVLLIKKPPLPWGPGGGEDDQLGAVFRIGIRFFFAHLDPDFKNPDLDFQKGTEKKFYVANLQK